jgi:hypothetical protein
MVFKTPSLLAKTKNFNGKRGIEYNMVNNPAVNTKPVEMEEFNKQNNNPAPEKMKREMAKTSFFMNAPGCISFEEGSLLNSQ